MIDDYQVVVKFVKLAVSAEFRDPFWNGGGDNMDEGGGPEYLDCRAILGGGKP